MTESLLDRPVATAADVAAIEAGLAGLLDTTRDTVLLQGEAILALEAAARGLGRPGSRALNIVTGPYGTLFGRWLRAGGTDVTDLSTPFDEVIGADAVAAALERTPADIVSVVHAEATTGGVNPLDEIAEVVAAAGALLVVDAVASVGAHPVRPDAWRADIVAIGAQKALAGPAGVSALVVSDRAWQALHDNPAAPRGSYLSLLDIKHGWLDTGRRALPGYAASLETFALREALDRVADETLPTVIRRHRAAAAATRAGLRALGLRPWIGADAAAAAVATTFGVPDGYSADEFAARARAAGAGLTAPAPEPLAVRALRVGHAGRAATDEAVRAELTALAAVLGTTPGPALTAARVAAEETRG
jgi:aspartate aminotransferase-like enzyme